MKSSTSPTIATGHLAASSYVAAELAELTEIYTAGINVVVHPRVLDASMEATFAEAAKAPPFARSLRALARRPDLSSLWPGHDAIARDVLAEVRFLVDVYAELFEAKELGIRLACASSAMCPRFHVDRVGARLVCAFTGGGTEWLDDACVDRTELGHGSGAGKAERAAQGESPELVQGPIFRMSTFDIGLLKGEAWPGNLGRGAVHRSPSRGSGPRVFLSIEEL